MNERPSVLCIGGHDPTGGAGIQADIETVSALGARALTLVTALTAQSTRNVEAVTPTAAHDFSRQFDTLIADIAPDAVKIGLIGNPRQAALITEHLRSNEGPVVLDPVLAAGGGFAFAGDEVTTAIRRDLLPLATLVTPNRAEARRLSGRQDPDDAARSLLDAGAAAVLVTGADEADGASVSNRLYTADGPPVDYAWPRLPHTYHGSGCTLASACATLLAQGRPLPDAVAAAQDFVWQALKAADRPGHGQHLPRRLRCRQYHDQR